MNNTPLLSIITTCKNRLDHLKQTLPFMLNQTSSEVIVVDYDCPQNTANWVSENHAEVKVVKVNDAEKFNASIARNLGAEKAIGKWFLFIDADIFLREDLGLWLEENANSKSFYCTGNPEDPTTKGTFICSSDAFKKVSGYDEAFTHWGGEDTDIYNMLKLLALKESAYPTHYIESIQHSDAERGLVGSKLISYNINNTYRTIKMDVVKILGNLPKLEFRQHIFELVKEQYLSHYETNNASICKVTVNLSNKNISRSFSYSFKPILKNKAS